MGTCRQLGYKVPFEFSKLDSMYGSAKNYASKVNQSVDRLVKERYLTESDGKKIKAELTGSSASNGTR
jgi:polyhydroxyalkanoate synthesis regulator phasin